MQKIQVVVLCVSCKILTTHREGREVVKLPLARKREGVEDTVCSIVHNVVSHDVTSEIQTRKSQSFLCDMYPQKSRASKSTERQEASSADAV